VKKTKKVKEPVHAGNACSVVCAFQGVPCSIDVYENEKQAIKAYHRRVDIHAEIKRRELGRDENMREEWNDRSRVKTSCSGLPHCVFDDGYGIAVVRGPMYTTMKATMPFVAVNYDDGRLNVVGFEDTAKAYETYDTILKSHDGSDIQEMEDGAYKAFSTDEISVAVGIADVVARGDECRLV